METIKNLILLTLASLKTHYKRAKETSSLGASTIEYILMALLGITIAGLVTAAIVAFVSGKISLLG